MFCQPSETTNNENKVIPTNLPSKNNLKAKRKQKKKLAKRNRSKIALTMSTWAENFTVAATWQLKHQISYWKARAKALEYENAVLHDVIRRNHYKLDLSSGPSARTDSVNETQSDQYNESENEEEGEFEVSEEFIQFLAENAKFKEEARRERERLRDKQEAETVNAEETPRETIEENQERLNELYGDKWQRISALETNMLSRFISECDKYKPVFWPNIPFNFNYS
ncbi:gem-associated protein 8-like [Aricia agestis]|uniref:gem-associated protein 8-like n=1 Tax=Aricia agestis TaxID=91739 RepID=UPI001C20BE1F|nr:gem-associated protein 8-like [Aricia agestis]